MHKSRICTVNLSMFLLGSLLLFQSCSPEDDVAAITDVVKKGVSQGEAHDISGIFKLTTEDFVALPGKLDRRETRRILFMAFHHYGEFNVLNPRPRVEVSPDRRTASAVFPFLIVKKEASIPGLKDMYEDPKRWLEMVGENADLYRLKLELVKDDGDWLVSQALLERFTGVSFAE